MKIKAWLLFGTGIGLYILFTLLILLFYKDDPDQMQWYDREVFNAKIIGRLDLNKTVSQDKIISRLGSPDITEASEYQGSIYQLLYYRTHRYYPDGITTVEECTALLFRDRRLIAIGEPATDAYKSVDQYETF